MAYSDYGGYAYRNGERVVERSDCTITPEGDAFGTPGTWPGFGMIVAGMDAESVRERTQWPHGHAVLGDGPIYVVLYKQSTVRVFRGFEELDTVDLLVCDDPKAVECYTYKGEEHRYIDTDFFLDERTCVLEVDGCDIEIVWQCEDNHYQYVRLTQPDGVVWTGWSGYGVGAGLENAGYGFSTPEREQELRYIFPE